MKTNYRPFARKFRQFNHQVKTIKRLHNEGKFELLSSQRQHGMIQKLKQLLHDLRGRLQPWRLKKTLAGLSFLLIGLGSMPQANAQVFGGQQLNPFNITGFDDGNNFVTLADIDNDGDLDLFSIDFQGYTPAIQFMENEGTAVAPSFGSPTLTPFGIPIVSNLTTIDFADIDGDGDLDLFMGTYTEDYDYVGNLLYFENTGDANNPSFAAEVTNPFNFVPTYYFSVPKFADIDNDGDMDLFVGEYYGTTQFFENIGSATAAEFAAPQANPFGIPILQEYVTLLDFADMDNDGDLDIMAGGNYGPDYLVPFLYLENIGDASNPDYGIPIENPFGLEEIEGYILYPEMADIDDDGDLDLFANSEYGAIFFENLGLAPTSADGDVTTTTDVPYAFVQTDFEFMDVNGDSFDAIKISTPPSIGMLEFNGTAVNVDQIIAVSDIASLVFTPLPGEMGIPYDSFVFQVADDQGAFSDDYTMTINVGGVGTKDQLLNAELQVFPNPSAQMIQLDLESVNALDQIQINLMDETGRILSQEIVRVAGHQWQQQFDVSTLAAGSYFIQINADSKTLSKQFVKK